MLEFHQRWTAASQTDQYARQHACVKRRRRRRSREVVVVGGGKKIQLLPIRLLWALDLYVKFGSSDGRWAERGKHRKSEDACAEEEAPFNKSLPLSCFRIWKVTHRQTHFKRVSDAKETPFNLCTSPTNWFSNMDTDLSTVLAIA